MRSREILVDLAMAVTSGVALVVCAEAFLRFFSPVPQRQLPLFQFHSVLGWRHVPGVSLDVRRSDGRVVRTAFNENGYRGPLLAVRKPAGFRRIIVLGDSFTEALGIADKDTYSALLEAWLDGAGQHRHHVIAFGTSSYGTVHECLLLKEVIAYQPDLVLVQMCVNDFWDSIHGLSYQKRGPWATCAGEHDPVTIRPPTRARDSAVGDYSPPWRRLASWVKWNSAIAYRLALVVDSGSAPGRVRVARLAVAERPVVDPQVDPRFRESVRVTCALLREMRQVCARAGSRFAVYVNPSTLMATGRGDGSDVYFANGLSESFRLDAEVEEWLFCQVLEFCDREGIECVWPRTLFLPMIASGTPVTFPNDSHWNEMGHRLVATDLLGRVRGWLR